MEIERDKENQAEKETETAPKPNNEFVCAIKRERNKKQKVTETRIVSE